MEALRVKPLIKSSHPRYSVISRQQNGINMVELSDVVKAQDRTSILLRAFIKILRVCLLSALISGFATAGYFYFAAQSLGSFSTSSTPQSLCLLVIVVSAIATVILTFNYIEYALERTKSLGN